MTYGGVENWVKQDSVWELESRIETLSGALKELETKFDYGKGVTIEAILHDMIDVIQERINQIDEEDFE